MSWWPFSVDIHVALSRLHFKNIYLPPKRLEIEPLLVKIARAEVLVPSLYQLLRVLTPFFPGFLHFRRKRRLLLGEKSTFLKGS